MDGELRTLIGINPTYMFETPGNYTITLNVTDTAENCATDTAVVTVRDTTKPTANANHAISVNLMVWTATFDASESSDNVGIASCEWDFGDGSTATGQIVSHTYVTPGVYNVTLTARDEAGNTDSDSIVVAVHPPTFRWWTPILIAVLTVLGISTTLTISLKKRKRMRK